MSNSFSKNPDQDLFVYPTFAQISHSCVPNSKIIIDPKTNSVTVRSIKPIPRHTKITVSKCDAYQSRIARANQLENSLINCRCICCSLSHELSEVSDRRRMNIKSLMVILREEWIKGRCTGERFVREMYEILEPVKGLFDLEGIPHVEEFSTAYYWELCCQIAATHQEPHITKYCALKMAEARNIATGFPEELEYCFKIIGDPTLHQFWGKGNFGNVPFDREGKGEVYKLFGIEREGSSDELTKKKNKKKKKKKSKSISISTTDSITFDDNASINSEDSTTSDLLAAFDLRKGLKDESNPFKNLKIVKVNQNNSNLDDLSEVRTVLDLLNSHPSDTKKQTPIFTITNLNLPSTTTSSKSFSLNDVQTFDFTSPTTARDPLPTLPIPTISNSKSSTSPTLDQNVNKSNTTTVTSIDELIEADKALQKAQKKLEKKERAKVRKLKEQKDQDLSKSKTVEISIQQGVTVEEAQISNSKSISSTPLTTLSTQSSFPPPIIQSTTFDSIPLTLNVSTEPTSSYNPTSSPPILPPQTSKLLAILNKPILSSGLPKATASAILSPSFNQASTTFISRSLASIPEPSKLIIESNKIPAIVEVVQNPKVEQRKVHPGWAVRSSDVRRVTERRVAELKEIKSNEKVKVVEVEEKVKKVETVEKVKEVKHEPEKLKEESSSNSKAPPNVPGILRPTGWDFGKKYSAGKFSSSSTTPTSSDVFQKKTFRDWRTQSNLHSNFYSISTPITTTIIESDQDQLPTVIITPPTSPIFERLSFSSILTSPPALPPPSHSIQPIISVTSPSQSLSSKTSSHKSKKNGKRKLDPHLAKIEKIRFDSEERQENLKENLIRVATYPVELPLDSTWTLLFADSENKAFKVRRSINNYQLEQIELFKASTVSSLCINLKTLAIKLNSMSGPLDKMKDGMSLSFFRDSIEPVWEADWNKIGGRLIYFPRKPLDEDFLSLVFLAAGSSLLQKVSNLLKPSRERGTITGIVASKRSGGDRIEIWCSGKDEKSKVPSEWLEKLQECLMVELEIKRAESLTYKRNS